ncbi:MAG: hypothetical protein ABIS01_16825, partial [Ferruginibacter sp.]
MKTLSLWAKHHVKTARALIVCIRLFLAVLAYYTGRALYTMDFILPQGSIYMAALLVLLIVVAVYPERKSTTWSKKYFYARQKICDFILPLASCLVIITTINNID